MMEVSFSRNIAADLMDLDVTADFIASLQRPDGEIPWSEGGKTDPWDHVESAMGLAVAGRLAEAEKAFGWLERTQLPDGSWWSATKGGIVEDSTKDSNIASYVAVGVYHFYLITGDLSFVRRFWPVVEKGIDYAVGLQADSGEIAWARNGAGVIDPMALLTGSSSIYMSLKCAISLANLLHKRRPAWEEALARLRTAIVHRPNLFNRMKARFSMDWYYPVLCGAMQGEAARGRIDRSWEKFVVPEWGVRCVSDQPWVTTAEAAELVLALAAIGETERAQILFQWIADKRHDDGSYWMGVTFPDGVIWPEEKTSWTAAAVMLAGDALYGITPGGRIFNHTFWGENEALEQAFSPPGNVHRTAFPQLL